jgi:hypothetical protein
MAGTITPNAKLRDLILQAFDETELEILCFDLGIDYESLPGQSKVKKTIELIEYCVRSSRLPNLLDWCEGHRPAMAQAWQDLRSLAVNSPTVFALAAVTENEQNTAFSVPAARALRLGIGIGAGIMLIIFIAFSGGIFLGTRIAVANAPVQTSPTVGNSVNNTLNQINQLPAGTTFNVGFSDTEASSYLRRIDQDFGLQNAQVRFTENNEAVVKAQIPALGNREVLVTYELGTQNGRLTANLKGAAVNVLRLQNTNFGWVAIPNVLLANLDTQVQNQLVQLSRNVTIRTTQLQPVAAGRDGRIEISAVKR